MIATMRRISFVPSSIIQAARPTTTCWRGPTSTLKISLVNNQRHCSQQHLHASLARFRNKIKYLNQHSNSVNVVSSGTMTRAIIGRRSASSLTREYTSTKMKAAARRRSATITSVTTPLEVRDLLRHILLKPRSLPLPRYISPHHYSFTLSELFGHASFLLVGASYVTQDFLQLRILAISGASAMLAFSYFHPHGRILWLPIKWNALFIAINVFRVGKIYYYQYKADNLSDEMKQFRHDHLGTLWPSDFYKLISMAVEEEFGVGDMILHQGQPNPHIRIVLEGELQVLRDGTLTYLLEKGSFVSECGLHAGLMLKGSIESCCSIVVGPPFDPTGDNLQNEKKRGHNREANRVRCLRWDRTKLVELLEDSSDTDAHALKNALKAVLSWDVVHKLKMQRHMLMEGRVKDPTSWTKKREEQGISRYAAILQSMLRHPEVCTQDCASEF